MKKLKLKSKIDEQLKRLIERPDGYYWTDEVSGKEFGSFATLLEAEQDMQGLAVDDFEEEMPLLEADNESDICNWIDPNTGDIAIETAPRFPD